MGPRIQGSSETEWYKTSFNEGPHRKALVPEVTVGLAKFGI